jgi:hypothetical protein
MSRLYHFSLILREWLEVGLAWLALLPRRIRLGLGLLLAGLIMYLFSSFVVSQNGPGLPKIYAFNDSTLVAAAPINQARSTSASISRSYSLQRPPTIEPNQIEAVLSQYHSPALGQGQALYNLGIRYGIDPAFALAFFIHESSAGTQGVAAVTKSIGNIRCTSGYDCYQTSGNGSFRRYVSWEAGAEDWYRLIKEQYIERWGLKTLEQIIPVYAPSADRNNPATYIQQVATLVDSWQLKNR